MKPIVAPPRWAWWTAALLVGVTLLVTEFFMVLAITLGLFHEKLGLSGWLGPLATLTLASAAVYVLARLLAALGPFLKRGLRWDVIRIDPARRPGSCGRERLRRGPNP